LLTVHLSIFIVLLTVHLSIFISVINQLDAQNFCFTISLFYASTCFEHRSSKLYYTASGIITSIGVMITEAV
jgi:4-amino-4-deoxy-L-arabinose transferase-like glycosyltransferase